jgi:heptaprenyl diphosphate synthase
MAAAEFAMNFFSNADIPVTFELLAWVQSFLIDPHPQMKRSPKSSGEAICPFAKAVLDENALYMTFHREVNGKSVDAIESIVLGYREPFKKTTPFNESDRLKKALLIIFPEIPAAETGVLDIAHANVKSACVHDGLMVAQCHPRCDGRSVHSPSLKVYTAPHAMMAMRHMAFHDILFLQDNESWFASYDLRFGARFREPEKLEDFEKPLVDIYRRAKARLLR